MCADPVSPLYFMIVYIHRVITYMYIYHFAIIIDSSFHMQPYLIQNIAINIKIRGACINFFDVLKYVLSKLMFFCNSPYDIKIENSYMI